MLQNGWLAYEHSWLVLSNPLTAERPVHVLQSKNRGAVSAL